MCNQHRALEPTMTEPSDTDLVLSAVRLGWYLAEVRGRNRPNGPPGAGTQMPDHRDHALPLRIERGRAETRIEAQTVLAALANKLGVDSMGHRPVSSYGATVDNLARVIAQARAPKIVARLNIVIDALHRADSDLAAAQRALDSAQKAARVPVATQSESVAGASVPASGVDDADRRYSETKAAAVAATVKAVTDLQNAAQLQQTIASDQQTHANQTAAAQPPDPADAKAAALLAQLAAGEQASAHAAQVTVGTIQQAVGAVQVAPTGPQDNAVEAALAAVNLAITQIGQEALAVWESLSDVLWKFDAHIQDELTAKSDTQACGYQLGRGLAESYWALNPDEAGATSSSWKFLLGTSRCEELTRLTGRLSAYMGSYTPAAVLG